MSYRVQELEFFKVQGWVLWVSSLEGRLWQKFEWASDNSLVIANAQHTGPDFSRQNLKPGVWAASENGGGGGGLPFWRPFSKGILLFGGPLCTQTPIEILHSGGKLLTLDCAASRQRKPESVSPTPQERKRKNKNKHEHPSACPMLFAGSLEYVKRAV